MIESLHLQTLKPCETQRFPWVGSRWSLARMGAGKALHSKLYKPFETRVN